MSVILWLLLEQKYGPMGSRGPWFSVGDSYTWQSKGRSLSPPSSAFFHCFFLDRKNILENWQTKWGAEEGGLLQTNSQLHWCASRLKTNCFLEAELAHWRRWSDRSPVHELLLERREKEKDVLRARNCNWLSAFIIITDISIMAGCVIDYIYIMRL